MLPATATGFVLGGVSFAIANFLLERKSKSKRSHSTGVNSKNVDTGKSGSGRSLFIGSLMDNIPENAALGITLATGGAINIALLVAIFVSNLLDKTSTRHWIK